MTRYANKRLMFRSGGGQFRKAHMSDMGIGGTCPTCNHFLLAHYDGDPRDPFPDPRKFGYRCFSCQPETDTELARKAEIAASQPKSPGILDILRDT